MIEDSPPPTLPPAPAHPPKTPIYRSCRYQYKRCSRPARTEVAAVPKKRRDERARAKRQARNTNAKKEVTAGVAVGHKHRPSQTPLQALIEQVDLCHDPEMPPPDAPPLSPQLASQDVEVDWAEVRTYLAGVLPAKPSHTNNNNAKGLHHVQCEEDVPTIANGEVWEVVHPQENVVPFAGSISG